MSGPGPEAAAGRPSGDTRRKDPALVVGLDIGGTNMQAGVVDASNQVIGRTAAKTKPEAGLNALIDTIAACIAEACAEAGVAIDDVMAVGIAAAGAIDIPRGIVLDAPNLGLRDVPLRDLVQGQVKRPTVLENDVNGATWGEYVLGAGAGPSGTHEDALGVWIGTGVGGGLVLGGRLHYGAFFTAGEIGQTIIEPPGGNPRHPNGRTVEDICSRTGMRRTIADLLPAHPESQVHALTGGEVERLGTDEIRAAVDGGDELMTSVVNRAAELLGVAIANAVTMLAIDTVYVGGGITEALGESYLSAIRSSFQRSVFPERCRTCRLVMTELAADAGLLGAALIARDQARRPDAS